MYNTTVEKNKIFLPYLAGCQITEIASEDIILYGRMESDYMKDCLLFKEGKFNAFTEGRVREMKSQGFTLCCTYDVFARWQGIDTDKLKSGIGIGMAIAAPLMISALAFLRFKGKYVYFLDPNENCRSNRARPFFMRFVVQWWCSEKEKRSVIPVRFWYFSITGSTILLIYSIHRRDPILRIVTSR